jgi:hypothetical protein
MPKKWKSLLGSPLIRRTQRTFVGYTGVAAAAALFWLAIFHSVHGTTYAYPLIVFLLSVLVLDSRTSLAAPMEPKWQKSVESISEQLHDLFHEAQKGEKHALAHLLKGADSFKQEAMQAVGRSQWAIHTVLSEVGAEYLETNFEDFTKVFVERMCNAKTLRAKVVYCVNLASPTTTTRKFLELVQVLSGEFKRQFNERFEVYVANGEKQLEFSVYDGKFVAIFLSRTREATLWFDNEDVAAYLNDYFRDVLVKGSCKLEDALKKCPAA